MLDNKRREYLTVREAAKHLGVSRSTVYKLVGREELRALRLGSIIRITRDELLRFQRDGAM